MLTQVPVDAYQVRLKPHGSHQVEIKVHFPVKKDKKKVNYTVDLYIFTPSQLRLDKERYGVEGFLRDLQSYTRFSTPSITINKLLDPSCQLSPLNRIRGILVSGNLEDDRTRSSIHYELQALVNIIRAEIRSSQMLYREIMHQNGTGLDLNYRIKQTLEEIELFLTSFRKLHGDFVQNHLDSFLRSTLSWADEAISIYVEKFTFSLHSLTSKRENLQEVYEILKDWIGRERNYRKKTGYLQSLVDLKSPITGERRLYRESTLKKWSQSSLYLTSATSNTPKRLMHLFASIAAALAMSIAVLAAFFADKVFAAYSLPWAFIIIAAYMLKDRTKEVSRSILIKVIPKLVADIINNLIDKASGKKVGISRTLIRFPRINRIPESVLQLRDHGKNPFRAILPEENVIHFHKETIFDCEELLKHHQRLDSVTGIVRFKLDQWFSEMDNPITPVKFYNNGKIESMNAQRVYHSHLILRLSRRGEDLPPSMYHSLMVVNRDGIVRIEEA